MKFGTSARRAVFLCCGFQACTKIGNLSVQIAPHSQVSGSHLQAGQHRARFAMRIRVVAFWAYIFKCSHHTKSEFASHCLLWAGIFLCSDHTSANSRCYCATYIVSRSVWPGLEAVSSAAVPGHIQDLEWVPWVPIHIPGQMSLHHRFSDKTGLMDCCFWSSWYQFSSVSHFYPLCVSPWHSWILPPPKVPRQNKNLLNKSGCQLWQSDASRCHLKIAHQKYLRNFSDLPNALSLRQTLLIGFFKNGHLVYSVKYWPQEWNLVQFYLPIRDQTSDQICFVLWLCFLMIQKKGPVHIGRVSRFACKPFDIACNLCVP